MKGYKISKRTITTIKLDEYINGLNEWLKRYEILLKTGRMSHPTYRNLISSIKNIKRIIETSIPLGKEEERLNEKEAKEYITKLSEILEKFYDIKKEVDIWEQRRKEKLHSKK